MILSYQKVSIFRCLIFLVFLLMELIFRGIMHCRDDHAGVAQQYQGKGHSLALKMFNLGSVLPIVTLLLKMGHLVAVLRKLQDFSW